MEALRVTLDAAVARSFFTELLRRIELEQVRLDRLDAVAGDGDHGATMVLGMRAVVAAQRDAVSLPELLRLAAEAFSSVGGSIGPLWGTALLRAARAADGRTGAHAETVALMLTKAVQGLRDRGRCELGDKTLLDVMEPAAVAFAAAARSGASGQKALDRGLEAARQGLAESARLPARRGRARRVEARSVGVDDPGAASACLAWETAAQVAASWSAPAART
jgi:dihydroxyacetone kinase-like protein